MGLKLSKKLIAKVKNFIKNKMEKVILSALKQLEIKYVYLCHDKAK